MALTQYDPSVPEYLRTPAVVDGADAFTSGIGGSRGPHVTLRAGRFFLVGTDGTEQIVNTFDPQAGPYLDVLLVDAGVGISKVYYEGEYVQGQNTPPTCFSNDGVYPDQSVAAKQSSTCASCHWNVWGSETTQQGKQAKACSDRKKLAVLNLHDLKGPLYELSLSPSNLKPFNEYAQQMTGRGIPLRGIVTRITVNPAAVGAMLFQPAISPTGTGLWFVPQPVAELMAVARASDECKRAIGALANGAMQALPAPAPQAALPAPLAAPAALSTPASLAPPAPAQTIAAAPATAAPSHLQPGAGTAPVAAQAEQPRKRRTKAEMEAARVAQQGQPPVGQLAVAGPAADPMSGYAGPAGIAAPAAAPVDPMAGFGGTEMPPIPAHLVRNPAPVATPPAAPAFGVVTQPAPVPPELDAMLAQVLGK